MKKTYPIITITREYGSNGRTIGRKLAKLMGIAFYDDELIELAAKESNFDPRLFERAENTNASNSFLYAINRLGAGSTYNVPLSDQLFSATSNVIRKIADTQPAVIVGRCADYVLRDYTRTVNVFMQAPMEFRTRECMERMTLTEARAQAHNKKMDKSQASYYNFYTDQKFGSRRNYDLIINTEHLELEQAASLIQQYAQYVFGEELEEAKKTP